MTGSSMKKGSATIKKELTIELENVTKVYTIHHQKPTLAEQIIRRRRDEQFTALKNISLQIYAGDKVGIIGSNGSGKTTLLKIITGITAPTSGRLYTKGKIVSLIDLEAGFHPDLSGEENIYLNGLIIGMNRDEIQKNIKKIIAFADIGSFIDAPLYTYSAGMKLRLGFAIAVYADPDILILDENISVGDENFREKSSAKIEEFFKKKKTIIIVSHWIEYLKEHCNKIIFIKQGKIISVGKVEVIDSYIIK